MELLRITRQIPNPTNSLCIAVKFTVTRSKFNKSVKCGQVDGCVDPDAIADNFVSHFRKAFTHNNPVKAESKGRIFSSAW